MFNVNQLPTGFQHQQQQRTQFIPQPQTGRNLNKINSIHLQQSSAMVTKSNGVNFSSGSSSTSTGQFRFGGGNNSSNNNNNNSNRSSYNNKSGGEDGEVS